MITKELAEELKKLAYHIDLSEDVEILYKMASAIEKQDPTELLQELLFIQSRLTESNDSLTSAFVELFGDVIDHKETIVFKRK